MKRMSSMAVILLLMVLLTPSTGTSVFSSFFASERANDSVTTALQSSLERGKTRHFFARTKAYLESFFTTDGGDDTRVTELDKLTMAAIVTSPIDTFDKKMIVASIDEFIRHGFFGELTYRERFFVFLSGCPHCIYRYGKKFCASYMLALNYAILTFLLVDVILSKSEVYQVSDASAREFFLGMALNYGFHLLPADRWRCESAERSPPHFPSHLQFIISVPLFFRSSRARCYPPILTLYSCW
jgi:hypothetical protein